ncbi:MAG TPA: NAD-dependent epimerase/dehydratase family protein, partial [Chloroflexota bacterium]|nr:NAD-dependent epimerase/dehydratase family protein [Chloroflexota bacterium]
MRIAVTGGAGNVGGFVVDELADNGHVPMIIDTAFPHISEMPPRHRINIRRADLTDLGQAIAAVEGCEAVIHLAAIPHPFWDSRPKVFLHNITCLYNTLEAARQAGIDKVVTASSDSTLGFSFAYNPFQPDYFPIDEVHPLRPQDPYCLSKAV